MSNHLWIGLILGACVDPGALQAGRPGGDGAEPADLAEAARGVALHVGFTSESTSSTPEQAGSVLFEVQDRFGDAITIDGGFAVVRHIELDLPDGETCSSLHPTFAFESPVRCDGGEDKIEVVGPFTIDLATGASSPTLAGLTIPAGDYRRVDIRLHPSSAPSGITLGMSGYVTRNEAQVAFEVALEVNEDARFESPEGVRVEASDDLLAMIDLDAVIAQTALGRCAATLADDQGFAVIDRESDCGDELEDAIEDAVKETFDLD